MLNLTYYQSFFNEDNTEIRCRKVLEEISPVLKLLFERFIERFGVSVGNEFILKSYDSTLSTTYSDARNPDYAQKKKTSEIGRNMGLNRIVEDKEYNFFTLEFNGIDRSILIHT